MATKIRSFACPTNKPGEQGHFHVLYAHDYRLMLSSLRLLALNDEPAARRMACHLGRDWSVSHRDVGVDAFTEALFAGEAEVTR